MIRSSSPLHNFIAMNVINDRMNTPPSLTCTVSTANGTSKGQWADPLQRSIRLLAQLFALLLCALTTTGCAWMDNKKRLIVYRPTPGIPADFAGLRPGDERFFVSQPKLALTADRSGDTAAQSVEMWWLPHADKNAPTLLYYHGTFRNLFQNLHKIDALRQAGFAVLAVEYRGWGVSTPIIPSEQSIMQDADLAWAELTRREPRPGQRVIYGHSMGSGVAVDLASRLQAKTDYGALILESALTSFRDVAYEAGWLARLLSFFNNERFASIEKISRITAPLLMIHGDMDTTIPIHVGANLFAAASAPKVWAPIEGAAHSDAHQIGRTAYQAALQNFKNKYILGL
jgi:uncharacterized protein